VFDELSSKAILVLAEFTSRHQQNLIFAIDGNRNQ
jgi:hypothetical protein